MKKIAMMWVLWQLAHTPTTTPVAQNVVDDAVVIQNVTVVSPERRSPLPHAVVVIRDGRIRQIGTDFVAGPNATTIDGRGRFLIPGLIDSHVHVGSMAPLDENLIAAHPELLQAFRAQLPRSYLAFGFTTLVDLDVREQTLSWFNAVPVRPTLYHCGRAVRVVGGYGAQRVPKDVATAVALNIVYEPGATKDWPAALDPRDYSPARVVDRVVAAGGICVKTFVEAGFGGAANWPVPRTETLDALRTETRQRGLAFIVHANSVESWNVALRARPDVIAHGLWHWGAFRLDTMPPRQAREAIAAAAHAGVGVQPTLQAIYGDQSIFDRSLLEDSHLTEALPRTLITYLKSDQAQASHRAVADEYRQAIAKFFGSASVDGPRAMSIGPTRATSSLRMMVGAKVKLLFGSDTPSNAGIGNPPGLNGRWELTRWSEAGVPLSQILRAATLDNAIAFGLSPDLGTIEVGKRADLLLLRANPLQTITAYDAIDAVFVGGIPVSRSSLLPN
jgi:imidazolonepropionase-like amidohydrolase